MVIITDIEVAIRDLAGCGILAVDLETTMTSKDKGKPSSHVIKDEIRIIAPYTPPAVPDYTYVIHTPDGEVDPRLGAVMESGACHNP